MPTGQALVVTMPGRRVRSISAVAKPYCLQVFSCLGAVRSPRSGAAAMVAGDPCLTTPYVTGDACCQAPGPVEPPLGPQAALRRREGLTRANFGPWQACGRAPGVESYGQRHRRSPLAQAGAMPPAMAPPCLDQASDRSGVPTRRPSGGARGGCQGGRLWAAPSAGEAEGCHRPLAVNPGGVVTGFGYGRAGTKGQRPADTCFARRRSPQPVRRGVGALAQGHSVVD
jgi:hypothetical protein